MVNIIFSNNQKYFEENYSLYIYYFNPDERRCYLVWDWKEYYLKNHKEDKTLSR